MKYKDMVDMLQAEVEDAEISIDDTEEIITALDEDINNLRMEIAFIEGRRCLACCLLQQIGGKQIEEA